MSGVFLSYSRGDRAIADRVIQGLRPLGVDVWWDEDMPGVDWQEELARRIQALAAVVVIWTPLSSASKNVRDEARLGQHTEKLVNALIGVPAPPFPFDRTNGLPLDGWTGRAPHGGWTRLVQTIEERLVAVGRVKPGEVMAALAAREAAIRASTDRIALAEDAFAAAKAGEAAAAEAVGAATEVVGAAEDLLKLVVDRRAEGAVLRAAQTDVETARGALAAAKVEKTAAAAPLAEASRGLTRARADLERMFEVAPPAVAPPVGDSSIPGRTPEPAAVRPKRPAAAGPDAGRPSAKAIPAWAIAGLTGAAAVVALVFALGRHASAPAGESGRPAGAASVAAPPAANPTAAAAQALAGDWSGNGAACWSNPLRIAINGSTLRETLSGTPSTGAITGADGAHAVRVKFPGDASALGDQTYAVAGDTLTLTVSGQSMTYQRCRS